MRYYISKRYKIITTVKIVISVVLTVALSVGVMHVFGEQITKSAFNLMFDSNYSDMKIEPINETGFDDDFLTFIDFEKTEEAEQPAVLNLSGVVNSEAVAVNLSAVSGKYALYNGTSVINNTDYDVSPLMYADFELPKLNKDEPYILIYHTHTSEEYYGGGSVVDVGNTMAEEFEKLGYKTIHLTTVYDKEQFSGAYSRSINGVTNILEKYPSIRLVFDVHRDSITAADGTQYRPVTTVDGNECAQVMIVCGTDAKGLEHPNWRKNFKFALGVSRTMNSEYNALSRPINLRGDRFNTHVTDYTFLIEMGSSANTLDEANLAAKYTARSIIDTIEK